MNYHIRMENIILGSAGWRSEYAGKLNILSGEQINKFLSEISNFGINHIDTAPSYGDAEEKIFQHANSALVIDTKINPFRTKKDFYNQLKKLSKQNINTLYFHDPKIIQKSSVKQLQDYFNEIKNTGFKMGFSLYDLESFQTAYSIFSKNKDVIFQVPINLFDLKFLKLFAEENIAHDRIVGRSIFSRGLIFLNNDEIYQCFAGKYEHVKSVFEKFYQKPFCKKSLHDLTFSLINFLQSKNIKTLFGVNNIEEVRQILNNISKNTHCDLAWDDMIRKSETISKIEDLIL